MENEIIEFEFTIIESLYNSCIKSSNEKGFCKIKDNITELKNVFDGYKKIPNFFYNENKIEFIRLIEKIRHQIIRKILNLEK